MKYIAHKDGEREQTIKEHLIGTATLAGQFAEKFGSKDWGYCGGMLHDIGKYSEEFQKKINEDTNNMVDHATAGAQLCKKINLPVLDYCIAGHHAGLPDYGNTAERSSLCGRYKKKIYNYEAYQEEIKIPEPVKKVEESSNEDVEDKDSTEPILDEDTLAKAMNFMAGM